MVGYTRGRRPPEVANVNDFDAIAALNVGAYREFASSMTPEGWRGMEANLRDVEARAQTAQFLVRRERGVIVGSVAYCPPGRGNPEIFPPEWAATLLLAVAPFHRGHGIARELATACIRFARNDAAQVVGLFTSEPMTAAQQLYESLGFRCESEIPPRHGLRYWRYKLPLSGWANRIT